MTPTNDNVVIRRAKPEDKVGSIYIPLAKNADKTSDGVIVAVGPKVTDVKAGDYVVFNRYLGQEFVHEGETLLVYPVDRLFAVLT